MRQRRGAAILTILAVLLTVIGALVAPSPAAAASSPGLPLGLTEARSVAVDPGTGKVFIAGDDKVLVRDPKGEAVGSLSGVLEAREVVAADGVVFVLARGAGTVIRIQPAHATHTGTWSLAPATDLWGLAYAGGRVWTTGSVGTAIRSLLAIDPTTGVVVEYPGLAGSAIAELEASPAAPNTLIMGDAGLNPAALTTFDVSGPVPTKVAEVTTDGFLRDLATSPDGTTVLAASGSDGVEVFALPGLARAAHRYPDRQHEHAVATVDTEVPGGVVAVADQGSSTTEIDLWIYRAGEDDPVAERTLATAGLQVAEGGLAFSANGARFFAVRTDRPGGGVVQAQLVVEEVAPFAASPSPRVAGTRGGAAARIDGYRLSDVTIEVGGLPATNVVGTETRATFVVPALPEGPAVITVTNRMGLTSTALGALRVRDLGPFRDAASLADRQSRDFLGWGANGPSRNQADGHLWAGVPAGYTSANLVRTTVYTAQRAPLIRLYQAVFLRPPDTAGMAYWLAQLRAGRSLTWVASAFAASPEFRTQYGALDDGEFVDRVYENVLGRPADPDGRAYWVGVLASGQPRGKIVLSFSQSTENRAATQALVDVVGLHLAMLRRAPTAAEVADGVEAIEESTEQFPLAVYASSILLSEEYFTRIG
ncbi:MAG TPA: DUF4214 domain-containing protein [Iamia sp.]|nr:DUF4214 domain-containing protein [Iamia sp.]